MFGQYVWTVCERPVFESCRSTSDNKHIQRVMSLLQKEWSGMFQWIELPIIKIKYLEYTADIAMITYFSKLLELIARLAVQRTVTTYCSWNSSEEDNIIQLPPSYNSKMGNESLRHAGCHFLFFWFLSVTPYSVMRYQQQHWHRQPNPQHHFHSDSSLSTNTLLSLRSINF